MSLVKKILTWVSPSSKEEKEAVELWKKQYIEEMMALKELHGEGLDQHKLQSYRDFRPEQAWAKVETNLGLGQLSEEKKVRVIPAFRWAAIFITVLAAVVVVRYYTSDSYTLETHIAGVHNKNIILPDQSSITLDLGAQLKETDFRKVVLQGRAFFDITKNPEDTFEIATDHGLVQVLGTSFFVNVSSEKTEVHVISGKVLIQNSSSDMYLTPGQKGVMRKDTMYRVDLSGSIIADWKSNILHFNNASLLEVLKTVADYYQVGLQLPDETTYEECTIRTRFVNAKLEDVLKELSLITKMKYELKPKQIIVLKMGC